MHDDDNPFLNKKRMSLFLLAAAGLLIFFTIAVTFSFKDKVFQTFFPKPLSRAFEPIVYSGPSVYSDPDNKITTSSLTVQVELNSPLGPPKP